MKHFYLIQLISTIIFISSAFGWGNRGHEMVAEFGNFLANPSAFNNCHISKDQIVEHATDPDLKWRKDVRRHPNEEQAHYFHVDDQDNDWKNKTEPKDLENGYLVYRIVNWIEKAKQQKEKEQWSELSETLFGLVHYLGDLSQPLHLTYKHDGSEVGLPDLHKQWESKMIYRYEKDISEKISQRLKKERIPSFWKSLKTKDLIFTIAEQSNKKSTVLFEKAHDSFGFFNFNSRSRRKKVGHDKEKMRVSKAKLFEDTGDIAADQLAIGAKLWAHVLNSICSN